MVNGDSVSTTAQTVSDPNDTAVAVGLPLKVKLVGNNPLSGKLEFAHDYDATELGTDVNSKAREGGGTRTTETGHPTGESDASHAAVAGLYTAYCKTAAESSIVYSDAAKTDNRLYIDYSVGVWVDSPVSADSTAPVVGMSAGFVNDSGIKWQDINGNKWSEDEVKGEL